MKNIETKKWLNKAIRRHERHMDGKEPTTGNEGSISQRLMMEEMKYALISLDKEVNETSWYKENIKKFPDESSSMNM